MPDILITGANRGVGLALARHYSTAGWTVHGTCRADSDASDLRDTGAEIYPLDVTNHRAIDQLARQVGGPLDVVIANAGVMGPRDDGAQEFGSLDYDAFAEVMKTNVFGAVKTLEAFTPHVARSEQKKLVAVTSKLGSIADTSGGYTIYRTSKAALNMALTAAAAGLAQQGIATLLIHPGWVQTRMGGDSAPTSPEESAAGIAQVIGEMTPGEKPPFRAFDGSEIPW